MYTKKVWKTGDTITADAMNNIEKQVEESSELYDVSYSDTLEWDGDTTGLHEVILTERFYKISDQILTLQQLEHCSCIIAGELCPIEDLAYFDENFEEVSDVSQASFLADGSALILVILKDFHFKNEYFDLTFKKGLYFLRSQLSETEWVHVSKLVSSDGDIFETTKIKPTYLPSIKNTLILTADDDLYLYYDGANTTDTNNRIKRDVIVDAISQGTRILFHLPDSSTKLFMTPIAFSYNDTYASCGITFGATEPISFYTAEYTPSS